MPQRAPLPAVVALTGSVVVVREKAITIQIPCTVEGGGSMSE